jgi:hypothetical protein
VAGWQTNLTFGFTIEDTKKEKAYKCRRYTEKILFGILIAVYNSYPADSFFHQCCTKFILVNMFIFLNHRGRKKNFDTAAGNKSDISSKKYFRCICLNSVGTALSLGRIFSISPPPPAHKADNQALLKRLGNNTKY